MKKIYIAGKISDLPKEVYHRNFKEAEKEVFVMGYSPVNPCTIDHSSHDQTWLGFMRCDISELLKCDALYALNNWKESKGATIEVNLAISLGLEIHYQPCNQ